MLHVLLHVVVPALTALAFYRPRWRGAALVMLATMVVDVDLVGAGLLIHMALDAIDCVG